MNPPPHMDTQSKAVTQAIWKHTGLLYLAVLIAFIAMYLPQPIQPVLARDFNIAASTTALSVSALVFALALSSLFTGSLSDRLGRKNFIVSAMFLLSLPSLLCAIAPNFSLLVLWRFCQGLFIPGVTAVTVAYLSEEMPPPRVSSLVGGYIAATVAGGLSSRVLSGVVTQFFGWRWVFVLSAALSFLMAFLLLNLLAKEKNFQPKVSKLSNLRKHLKNPKLLGGYLVGFCLFFSFMGIYNYLPLS